MDKSNSYQLNDCCLSYLTTRESITGHSGWVLILVHYTEIRNSCSNFWGIARRGRGSNQRPPIPMTVNTTKGHRRIGHLNEY